MAPANRQDVDWGSALRAALADPDVPHLRFQPVLDLAAGRVVGYEALARFPGPPDAPPDHWFREAHRHGVEVELETRVVRRCLAMRGSLPPNCFLSLNLSPTALVADRVRSALDVRSRLEPLVIELTELELGDGVDVTQETLADLRRRGAAIALDDTGAGYSGLQRLLELRPQLVKLDRSLVADVQTDEVKRSLVELLGTLTNRLDAWLLAEGVERKGELETLISLGVPLAQGWLFGGAEEPWTPVDDQLRRTVVELHGKRDEHLHEVGVFELLQTAPPVEGQDADDAGLLFIEDPTLRYAVAIDEHRRPLRLLTRVQSGAVCGRDVLSVNVDDRVTDVARRAMARSAENRLDPVVCRDDLGRYLGIVTIERIVDELAHAAEASPSPHWRRSSTVRTGTRGPTRHEDRPEKRTSA